jgi:hypothetical protein
MFFRPDREIVIKPSDKREPRGVTPEKMADVFWLNKADFQPVAKVASPQEMVEALKRAPKQVINHHLNSARNDFANWAKHALKNSEMASRLASIKPDDPEAMQKVMAAFSGESSKHKH